MDKLTLQYVWDQQKQIPVVTRRKGHRLHVCLPYAEENRRWLRHGNKISPEWNSDKKYWELPKAWFDDFVKRALDQYGKVYIIQPYREREECAPACLNAEGHECQCSCMGQNHGAGNDGSWFEVSDTFAFRWGELHFACRLMTAKQTSAL